MQDVYIDKDAFVAESSSVGMFSTVRKVQRLVKELVWEAMCVYQKT